MARKRGGKPSPKVNMRGLTCIKGAGGRTQCARKLKNGRMKFVKNSTPGCSC